MIRVLLKTLIRYLQILQSILFLLNRQKKVNLSCRYSNFNCKYLFTFFLRQKKNVIRLNKINYQDNRLQQVGPNGTFLLKFDLKKRRLLWALCNISYNTSHL